MKKLITFALAALIAGNVFSADIKVSSVVKLRPTTLADSLAFLVTYKSGGLDKTRLLTGKDLIRILAQTDSGLTNSYSSGLGLRPAIGGIKKWHLNNNVVDGATIDFDPTGALQVQCNPDSGLKAMPDGRIGLDIWPDALEFYFDQLRIRPGSIDQSYLDYNVWYKGLTYSQEMDLDKIFRPMAHVDSSTINFGTRDALTVQVETDSGLAVYAGGIGMKVNPNTFGLAAGTLSIKANSLSHLHINPIIWEKGLTYDKTLDFEYYLRPMAHVDSTTMQINAHDALAVDTTKISTQYDLTTATAMNKDIVASGTGMSGGADNVLLGADSDVTITLTTNNDLLAGDGLGGGAVNVLPGTGSDVTFNILMDYNGGIQTLDDSIGIKLDGTTLALGADGLKVNPAGGVQFTTDSLSGARIQKRTIPENALAMSALYETDLTANDFNVSSGTVSLDYANGQKATTSLPGFLSSTDWNTFNGKMAGTLQNDLIAGDGLGGGAVNVLPGTGSDVTVSVLLDYNGGLWTEDDSVGIKLDGTSLSLGAAGLKVNPSGGFMMTANFDDSLNNAHTVLNSWGYRKNATTADVPIEVMRLELIDPSSVDLNSGEGPALNFYVAEATGTQQLGGQIATVRESVANANAAAAMIFSTAADDAALSEAMRITSANRVGISTTTPSHPLTIGHIGGLAVKGQDAAASTDSSWNVTIVNGQPVEEFNASDGKQYKISINTSDQALFAGASGGYSFDDDVVVSTGGKIRVGSLSWTRAGSDSIDGAVISLGTLPWEAMPAAAVLEGDLDSDDFDVTAHVVTLDYVNGQKASGSQAGFLSSTDWTTFNGSYRSGGTDVAVADGGTGTSTGSITGTGALTFTAGGSAQDVTLTPSSGGDVSLGGDTTKVNGVLLASGVMLGKTKTVLDSVTSKALVAADCKNIIRVNVRATAVDYTLPAAEAGLCVMFYSLAAGTITIDAYDTSDTIYLNGSSVGAGDAIDSPGIVGSFICLVALDGSRWITVGQNGVYADGGAD